MAVTDERGTSMAQASNWIIIMRTAWSDENLVLISLRLIVCNCDINFIDDNFCLAYCYVAADILGAEYELHSGCLILTSFAYVTATQLSVTCSTRGLVTIKATVLDLVHFIVVRYKLG